MAVSAATRSGQIFGRLICAWPMFLCLQILPPIFAAERDSVLRETNGSVAAARRAMVDRDLRGRGIKDPRVLAAMQSVPRHLFVPEDFRRLAYEDRALPIGNGQTISQPYIVAYMSELLELRGNEKVLEIGTGSGYQTAVLAHLAAEVYSIEVIPALSERASRTLEQLGLGNVYLKVGDGFFGWEEKAPFDAILLTAAAPEVPELLWRQLEEGGRMIMPLGKPGKTQRLVRVRKVEGKQIVEKLTNVVFVPMTGWIQKGH
ncbi:MAG TPA: protein-L-isoaspartate(D-aspartate) O-methyltransferase [Candidatus Binatia bacterium]|nr:protein-L-isoaspartate(D-aspartate) O-methyltransferase [Candidatus Binatia bacterium]